MTLPAPRVTVRRDVAAYLLGLALGAFVLVAFGFVEQLASAYRGTDLAGFWAGPRALLDGDDPYDPATWQSSIARLGTQPTEDRVYGYPPWMLVVLLPLGLLPLGPAVLLWTVLGTAAAIWATWILLRTVASDWPLLHGLTGAALLGSQPAIVTFYSGQWTFLLLAATAGVTVLWLRGRDVGAGALAASFLVKPHLFVLAALGFARAAVARGSARAIATAVVIALVPVGSVLLARPEWVASWIRHVPAGRATDPPTAATLPTALGDVFGPAGAWLAVGAVLLAIALAWRFDPRTPASVAVWLAVSLAAVVYGWSYDHLLLIVPVVIAAGVARGRSPSLGTAIAVGGMALLLVGEIALYQLAPARGSQSFNALVPALTAALIIGTLWPQRRVVAS